MARKQQNPHEDKVKEIRDNFDEDFQHWDPIYRAGETNMKFLTDPWDPMDRQAREAAGRPVVTFDEMHQYINLAQNEVRQNPRAPRFSPEAEGATDDTARVYGNLYRRTEYRSNAQEAYTTAYDNALTRGFAFTRLKLEYEHTRSFYQQYAIEPIPNPAACFPYCNSVRTDGSDWKRFSFVEAYSRSEFERAFPQAEFTDFSQEQIAAVGPKWVSENRVQVLEHWEVETEEKVLREFRIPATARMRERFVASLEGEGKPRGGVLVQERVTEVNKVFSQFTNGVELLKKGGKYRHEYPGSMIPFAPCYAKMIWVNSGSGPERKIISMVTMAREPYAAFCFLAACELEAIGTITKNPYWAYEGQLDTNLKNRVKQSLHEPVAILEAKAMLQGLPGQLLPLPQRNPMSVDLSAYAQAKEEARRSIMSAMMGSPLPTQAQKRNEKSGVALQKMTDTALKAQLHYTDHYNGMLRRCGEIFEDGIDKIADVSREMVTTEADKTIKRVFVGGWDGRGQKPEAPKDLGKDVEFLPSLKGKHAVIVDVGPEFDSQREEANTFLDEFVGSPLFASLEPPKRDKLMSMAIQERLSGPMGQKMAEVINPQAKGEMPPPEQLMAAIQEAKQVIIPGLEAQIAQLQQEKAARVVETEGKMAIQAQADRTKVQIAGMQSEQKQADTTADNATDLRIAELRAEIDLLKLHIGVQTKGAELEHSTVMTERGHQQQASEGDKQRQAAADEGERSRQATASEGEANRTAAAESAKESES